MTQADKFSDSALTGLRNKFDSDCIPISGIRNNRLLDRTLPGELFRLPDDYPELREILQQHFPLTADECNFSGGWGYDVEHATIVKEFDPEINPHKRFNGISLEYAFVDKRIWEELVHSKPMDERFQGFSYITVAQYLCDMDGILHDHLVGNGRVMFSARFSGQGKFKSCLPSVAVMPAVERFTPCKICR